MKNLFFIVFIVIQVLYTTVDAVRYVVVSVDYGAPTVSCGRLVRIAYSVTVENLMDMASALNIAAKTPTVPTTPAKKPAQPQSPMAMAPMTTKVNDDLCSIYNAFLSYTPYSGTAGWLVILLVGLLLWYSHKNLIVVNGSMIVTAWLARAKTIKEICSANYIKRERTLTTDGGRGSFHFGGVLCNY